MKIAVIVWTYLPHIGGMEIATLKIARGLTARGHDVHIITRRLDKSAPKEKLENGVHVHRLYWPDPKGIRAIAFLIHVLYNLRKIDPQIVHIQSVDTGLYAVLAKWLWDKPYVVLNHSNVYKDSEQHGAATVLKHAHTVIALSEEMKKEMQHVYPREVLIIPNGVDIEPFNKISRQRARHELGISEAEKIIIFVGVLHPRKGVRYLIESLESVRQIEPTSRLLLVGDGPEHLELEQFAKDRGLSDNITFLGTISEDAKIEYLKAADVFVLPTLGELLPLVCLEAMAANLPIVASRVGGIPSFVEDGTNGFLVDPKNTAQIAAKMLDLLQNPLLRRHMSDNNQRKIQQFTWESVAYELEQVYQRVL